jgi:nucleotide-binding universal stress UspA family protein
VVLNTVLVALDGSDITERVIQTLDNLVLSPDTKVVLCHVIPTPEEDIEQPADRPQSDSSRTSYLQLEKQLQTYQSRLSFKSELEVVSGDPAAEIICLANIYKAELILIGSRGLTGIKKIVQGSVSSQVMEEANCSVLVVKPDKN